ncbi:ML5 [Symbiodinium sp. CCMP2592]|nr:ML5 [Symbiodinium sp. CCMP2592]
MAPEQVSDFSDERTAIMLRRLPPKLATEKLLQVLDATGGGYNFVYMPHDRQKNRNVALAFVNYVDAARARSALQYFASGSHHPLLGHALRVSQADIQGLGPNLAFFVARCLGFGHTFPTFPYFSTPSFLK